MKYGGDKGANANLAKSIDAEMFARHIKVGELATILGCGDTKAYKIRRNPEQMTLSEAAEIIAAMPETEAAFVRLIRRNL